MTASRSGARPGEIRVARLDDVDNGEKPDAGPVAGLGADGDESPVVRRGGPGQGGREPSPGGADASTMGGADRPGGRDATADLRGVDDAVSAKGLVASLDGGGGPRDTGPVALFYADDVGATRADVRVADMGVSALRGGRDGQAAGRARGGAGRATSDGEAPRARRRRAGSTGPATGRAARTVPGSGGGPAAETGAAGRAETAGRSDVARRAAGDGRTDTDGTDGAGVDGAGVDGAGVDGVGGAGPRRERGKTGGNRAGSRWGASAELDPDADPVAVAREICLRLLTDRARTRQELADVLRRRGVPDEAAGAVLGRFDEVGLIDDAAFAGQWVRNRHTGSRGLGRRALAVELRRKGVADDVAAEALAEVDPEAEAQRARELVDRRLRSMTVTTPDEHSAAARRLAGMLARKGYGAGVTWSVVREALAAHGADLDDSEPPTE